MKEINVQCPFCGGTEFVEGKVNAYNGVKITMGLHRQGDVLAVVCRDCGSIVRWHISDVEKLLPKKERKTDKEM